MRRRVGPAAVRLEMGRAIGKYLIILRISRWLSGVYDFFGIFFSAPAILSVSSLESADSGTLLRAF